MKRRNFIKKGLMGSLLIFIVKAFENSAIAESTSPESISADSTSEKNSRNSNKTSFFSLEETLILTRLIEGILGQVAISNSLYKNEICSKTMSNLDLAVQKFPPHSQNDLKMLVKLLSYRPTCFALTGYWRNWVEIKKEEVDSILNSWSESSLAIRRTAYEGLRDLIFASWYGDTASWSSIHYPGVPQL